MMVRNTQRVALCVLVAMAWAVAFAASSESRAGQAPKVEVPTLEKLIEEGQAIYGAECVTCHAADGGEDMGPALSGSPSMATADVVVKRILTGQKDMPAFAKTLSNRQIAAVATFIRNAWENKHGIVLEADVQRLREAIAVKP